MYVKHCDRLRCSYYYSVYQGIPLQVKLVDGRFEIVWQACFKRPETVSVATTKLKYNSYCVTHM